MARTELSANVSSDKVLFTWNPSCATELDRVLDKAAGTHFDGVQIAVHMQAFAVQRWPEARLAQFRERLRSLRLELTPEVWLPPWEVWHLSADLARAIIATVGAIVNAAERLEARRLILTAPGVRDDAGCRQDVCDDDSESSAIRRWLMGLAGLTVGRCELCLEGKLLTAGAAAAAKPLLEAGFLHLCADLRPDGSVDAPTNCRHVFDVWAHRIRVVRFRSIDALDAPATMARLNDLLRLEVAEWTAMAHDVSTASAARQHLEARLAALRAGLAYTPT